jgi:hypothetical protein
MQDSQKRVLMIVVAVLVVFLLLWGMRSCRKKESFLAFPLESEATRFQGPVDYINDFKRSPGWKGSPYSKFKPLEDAPVDFYPDLRKLQNPDQLFAELNPQYVDARGSMMYGVSYDDVGSWNNLLQAARSGDLDTYRRLRPLDNAIW